MGEIDYQADWSAWQETCAEVADGGDKRVDQGPVVSMMVRMTTPKGAGPS